jgi:hypothetical protein
MMEKIKTHASDGEERQSETDMCCRISSGWRVLKKSERQAGDGEERETRE